MHFSNVLLLKSEKGSDPNLMGTHSGTVSMHRSNYITAILQSCLFSHLNEQGY